MRAGVHGWDNSCDIVTWVGEGPGGFRKMLWLDCFRAKQELRGEPIAPMAMYGSRHRPSKTTAAAKNRHLGPVLPPRHLDHDSGSRHAVSDLSQFRSHRQLHGYDRLPRRHWHPLTAESLIGRLGAFAQCHFGWPGPVWLVCSQPMTHTFRLVAWVATEISITQVRDSRPFEQSTPA